MIAALKTMCMKIAKWESFDSLPKSYWLFPLKLMELGSAWCLGVKELEGLITENKDTTGHAGRDAEAPSQT